MTPTAQSEFISRALPLTIAAERDTFVENARSSERLLVTFHSCHPRMRGYLGEAIFDAVEQTLREHGAPALDRRFGGDFRELLHDAVYRAGLVGASGLALEIEDLAGITDVDDTLHPDDGHTLSQWVEATDSEAVQLLLPPSVRSLKVYPAPVPLADLLPLSAKLQLPAVIEYSQPSSEQASEAVLLQDEEEDEVAPASLLPPALEAFAIDLQAEEVVSDEPILHAGEGDASLIDSAWDDSAAALLNDASAEAHEEPAAEAESTEKQEVMAAAEPALEAAAMVPEPEVPVPEAQAAPSPRPRGEHGIAPETFGHVRELEATRGPKALSVIERLYTSTYLPLQRAVLQGCAPSEAARVLEEWSQSFAKSYKEAFEALRARGRRPTMIMDLPELAHRLARLHGARHTQLLLVDGMSYELGQRINERLQAKLSSRAACAERLLLWAGLPATTATQLELLGRGQNALRDFSGEIAEDMVVNRGRTAANIRRIRTGHRELFKLDLVEAKLAGPGGPVEERLDEIADAVADVLVPHIKELPTGTLVMLFGDHGFTFEVDEEGNTLGALPTAARVDEVLAPVFAWVAGSVH